MTNPLQKLSDAQIVNSDKSGIYIGNIFTVESNLQLPSAGRFGSSITWKSKNTDVISDDGKVTRPENGKGNINVTLVAYISKGTVSDTREFEVTVLEKERIPDIISIKDIHLETTVGVPPSLPGVVITVRDDGSFSTAGVIWDEVEKAMYSHEGAFNVSGTVTGTAIKAKASVNVVPLAHDVPSKTCTPKLSVIPFCLGEAAVQDSIFAASRDRDYEYLLSLDDDRMLYNFRYAAGLDTKNALPLDGWDAPECNLKGHTTGHYLSALALAFGGSGDIRFKEKIDYMIAELEKCQEAMASSGKYSPGFLSGYSEEQFIKLEQLTTYPKIWAPYYTLHKIMAGLIDCYQLAHNKQALNICIKLGDWVYNRLSKLSREQLTNMWALYIAGEFGGMNEVMAKLYDLTGNGNYLKAALYFNNDKLFVPMADNCDTLGGMHANQHIPQIIGALQIYDVSSDPYYYNIAENFWNIVVEKHIYNIGGTGSGEMFKGANKIARYITDKTAETCASYNMLKLTRNLFFHNPAPKYMDYYEKALYNHILASQDQSGPTGGSTYFMPLCPGSHKEFDSDGNSCCHGTGMENHVKHQDSIYFHSADDSELYINLYISSVLNWKDKGWKITQSGNFLKDQAVSIMVGGSGMLKIKLRVPCWAKEGFEVSINGIKQNIEALPGSYIALEREWASGDRIDVSVPFSFRFESTPDDPSIVSIMYGPLVMVAISCDNKYIEIDESMLKSITPVNDDLTFTMNGITLVPNYAAYDSPYHAYFKLK